MQEYNFACGMYACETWSLVLREEHGLGVFEIMVLRSIFGLKGDEGMGGWRKCVMRSFLICTLHQV
jgi:hypothetical protein